MLLPNEMRQLLKDIGCSPAQFARAKAIFDGIDTRDAATRELDRCAQALQRLAADVKAYARWAASLEAPQGEETWAQMKRRVFRELREDNSHLTIDEFCAKFAVARSTVYGRLRCSTRSRPAGPVVERLEVVRESLAAVSSQARRVA